MKRIYILFAAITLIFSSCGDWLDVNKNPNKAVEVSPEYLFGYASTSWSANRIGGDSFFPIGFMNQTLADGGSKGWDGSSDMYDISPYSLGNTWKMYFSTAGNNYKQAIKLAEEANPVQNNVAAQAKIAFACMIYECTTIWGDIPFSEAWTNEAYPKFDTQKDVLDGIISLIDEAIAQIDLNNAKKVVDSDLHYKGDLDKWIKFANSIKLRVAMLMVDKDNTKASLIQSLIEGGNLLSSADDNFKFPYFNEPGRENIKHKLFKKYGNVEEGNDWIYANNSVLDLMKPYNDPRIEKFYDKGSKADEYIGLGTDVNAVDTINASFSLSKLWTPDAPDLILSYQEVEFFKAEAYTRGLGVAVNLTTANQHFKNAVRASMEYYGVTDEDITTFLAQPYFNLTTTANPLKVIHEQQYVDLTDNSLEAWTQMRRSGTAGNEVPLLTLPPQAPIGGIARRWQYPDVELTGNSNAPTTIPKMHEAMWFDE